MREIEKSAIAVDNVSRPSVAVIDKMVMVRKLKNIELTFEESIDEILKFSLCKTCQSELHFLVYRQNQRFCPSAEKYGSQKTCILSYFMQCPSLYFSKWKGVTILCLMHTMTIL